jgi:tetratricopeptide (TPR) repeat protein
VPDDGSRTPPEVADTVDGTTPASSREGELPGGTTFGRYVVLKRLGRGGMGIVYLGFDNELERRVAIKVLRPQGMEGMWAKETRARLLREAQALAKVSHPNVVAVYDVGTYGDEVFVAMQYVPGSTMREWCASPGRTTREILAAYVQAGRGLEAAHAEGVLHRDFKPDNVVVDERGRVRVLDFGLARLEPAETSEGASKDESASRIALDDTGVLHRDALSTPLTSAGVILGTPGYMAPEQLAGERATARSDQFSFCVALYEALYGTIPFLGDTVRDLVTSIRSQQPRPPRLDVRLPRGVRRAILRGLSADPADRFPSMPELLDAIERATASPKRWLGAVAVAATALAVAGLFALRAPREAACHGAGDVFAPAWSDARAADVARAFKGSGNARAEEALAHTKPLLDRYAASWVAMRIDACEATRLRGEQSDEGLDLRMECLQQRGKELEATVDLLARADTKTVDSAVEAAAGLTPVTVCQDVAALRAPFAPPKDASQRRAVDEVRRKLARAQALEHAGRWTEALEASTPLVDEATRTGYAPVLPEVLVCKGDAEYHLEKPEMTQTHLAAALAAEGARHDLLAAEAWIDLMKETGATREDFSGAALYDQIADAAVTRANHDDALRASLLGARGWVAYKAGAQREAREFAEQALAIRMKVLGPAHPVTLASRSDLGDRLFDDGDVEASLAMVEELHRERAALLGEAHPATVRSLGDMAQAEDELGDYAAALDLADRTIALASTPMRAADARLYRANALVGLSRFAEAKAAFEDGVARVRAARGAQSQVLGGDYSEYAQVLVERGLDGEAEANANLALDIVLRGDREQEKGQAYGVRALCKARRGDAAGAVTDASAALAMKTKYLGPRADLIPLLARGEALLVLHREKDGLADLEGALAIGDAKKGDAAIRADVRFALARALKATGGDAARATELAGRAANELERASMPEGAKRVRDWLRE